MILILILVLILLLHIMMVVVAFLAFNVVHNGVECDEKS